MVRYRKDHIFCLLYQQRELQSNKRWHLGPFSLLGINDHRLEWTVTEGIMTSQSTHCHVSTVSGCRDTWTPLGCPLVSHVLYRSFGDMAVV